MPTLKFTYHQNIAIVRIIFLLLSLSITASLFGQKNIVVDWQFSDAIDLPKKVRLKTTFSDSIAFAQAQQTVLQQVRHLGFIEASIDSVTTSDSLKFQVHFFVGKKYEWAYLQNGNLDEEVLKKTNLRFDDFSGGRFSFEELEREMQAVLTYYENNGYPFAEVWLDSFALVQNQVVASLNALPHELIVIDSVVVHGDEKTKPKFLGTYLGLRETTLYDESKVQQISQRLAQLPYLVESKPAQVVFFEGKAVVHLFVEKQRANQFDFVLGFLPNDQLSDKKLTITGDGELHLLNSFGVGEEIKADFSQLKPKTQRLNLKFAYPYFLNLPFGFDGAFSLYKNDTLFVDIDAEVGLLYQFGGVNQFRAFYQNQTSNVLNYDTATIKVQEKLPENIDVSSNQYGLGVHFQQLDYVFNPRKGYQLSMSGAVGTRTIKENSQIGNLLNNDGEALNYLYDDLQLKSVNYSLGFSLEYFLPIKKRSTFLLANHSEVYIAKNIFNNEKYRIGGSNLLRGFDEEQIYTPYYSVFTAEYRFLLSRNSYFHTFFDWAIVEDSRNGRNNVDFPLGFGAGVALETKGGIFRLSYALGKELDNPIQFRNGKIHFGYITLF